MDDEFDDENSQAIEQEQSSERESSANEEDSPDTEHEIAALKVSKSKKTLKRKRRATEPAVFGVALQTLLNTEAPSTLPLSLKPSAARQRNDEKLELQAKKVLQIEKKEKEDNGRITDLIGGWGAESERALRKVAQRGVVQLFNVIQQSQAAAAADERGPHGKGTSALTIDAKSKVKGRGKKNVASERPKETAVNKDDFFNMIRSGGIVSTT